MVDTFSPNLGLRVQTIGGNPNAWGGYANTNFSYLDAKLGNSQSVATTGGDTALTAAQQRVSRIVVAGALIANATLTFNATGGFWIIDNQTTGAYSVTVLILGQTGVVVPQGKKRFVFYNGTDIAEIDVTTTIDDAQLAAIAALAPASGQVPYFTAIGAAALADSATYGRSLWNVANEAALKALINAEAGVDFQGYDADLAAIALLTTAAYGRALLELANAAALVTVLNGAGVYKTGGYSGVRTVTSATTFVIGDLGGLVRMNVTTTAHNLNIPLNSSVAFAVGDSIDVVQTGTGVTTIKAAVGVTLNGVATGGGAISARWGGVTVVKVGTDAWEVYGAVGTVA